MAVGLTHFLVVSAILFLLGIVAIISRRNIIGVLLGIELVMNAAGLNFVAFSRYVANDLSGQIFTLFIILIAASEVVVALGILIRFYTLRQSVQVSQAKDLQC